MQKERKYKVGDIVVDIKHGSHNTYEIIQVYPDDYTIRCISLNGRPCSLGKTSEYFEDGTVLKEIYNSPLFQVMMELKSSPE